MSFPALSRRVATSALCATVLSVTDHSASAGLVAWWPFDEPAGVIANDAATGGNTHQATLEFGASFSPSGGKFGGAVVLDGSDDVVRVPDHGDFEFAEEDSFTISFWFKSGGGFPNTRGFIGKGYHTSPHTAGYYLVRAGGDGLPEFDSRESAGSTPRVKFDGNAVVDDGAWHHIVAVKDATAGEFRLFIDNGNPATHTITTSEGAWDMGINTEDIIMGRYLDRWTDGALDDVAIWDEALDGAAIASLYTEGVSALAVVDTDADGLPDGWEQDHFANLGQDHFGDPDEDGLTNLQEYNRATDPNDPDTDDDTLTDGAEFNIHGTDPAIGDSDGDGLTDGEEITEHGTDPLDADSDDDTLSDGEEILTHLTDPHRPDSDSDGFIDPVEIDAGTNPNNPQEFPDFPVLDGVLINEFLASNDGGLTDSDGDTPDWIEIWNPTAVAVPIGGWFLTDDPEELEKWAIPEGTILGAGQFLLVFASSKNRAGDELHTNFQIDRATGGYLALSRPAGDGVLIVGEFDAYPSQQPDVSFGWFGSPPSGTGYFQAPTPGAANDSDAVIGFVEDTQFSVDRGFYDSPFDVTVTSATPGATIIYTLDGTEPAVTPPNGAVAPPPDAFSPPAVVVPVTTTTVLRAMAVKDGYEPTNIDTHTYLFADHVLQQDGSGAPFNTSRSWGSEGPDWEMDPTVVAHPSSASRCTADDLKEIPTICLSLPFSDVWGNTPGIYISGEGVERACAIEYFNEDGNPLAPNATGGLQIRGTVQIVGGSSTGRWKSNNLSMRLKFDTDLEEDIFNKAWIPFGDEATDRFDTLVLDSRLNQVWNHPDHGQRVKGQYVRDQFMADLQNALGGTAPHGRHAHLFINGIYWGMKTVHERPDDNFAAAYFGGDNSEYDVVKHSGGTVVSGSSATYSTLASRIGQDQAVHANYESVLEMLDAEDFIKYMLTNYYGGNTDWDHHNWYASYRRTDPTARWHFHSWDAEHVLKDVNHDRTGTNNSGKPTGFHHRLMANSEYRLLFADVVYRAFFNGGPLTPENAAELYQRRLGIIDQAVRAESARWGDNKRPGNPYTRGAEWLTERNNLLNNYFPQRTSRVLGQFRNRGWYPGTEPPAFSIDGNAQHGGFAGVGALLGLSNPNGSGTIYLTTGGGDPREQITGTPAGTPYPGAIALEETTLVKARVLDGGEWSPLAEALFIVGTRASASNLIISEVMYNPPGIDDHAEFIELTNIATDTIDLTNVAFTDGISVTFAAGTKLAPGERLVVARLGSTLPGAGAYYAGSLDNGGERLHLVAADGGTIAAFEYNDKGAWPRESDGGGFSLSLVFPENSQPDYSDPLQWQTSVTAGGSPGLSESLRYLDWKTDHGIESDDSDEDEDGLTALAEFYTGGDPAKPDADLLPSAAVDADGSFVLSLPRRLGASGVTAMIEVTASLDAWVEQPQGFVFEGSTRAPGGAHEILRFRSPSAVSALNWRFARFRFEG